MGKEQASKGNKKETKKDSSLDEKMTAEDTYKKRYEKLAGKFPLESIDIDEEIPLEVEDDDGISEDDISDASKDDASEEETIEIDPIYFDDEEEEEEEKEDSSDIELLPDVEEKSPQKKRKRVTNKKTKKDTTQKSSSSKSSKKSGTVVRDQKLSKRRKRNPEWDLQVRFVEYLEKEMPNVLFCASIAGVWLGHRLGNYCKMAGYRRGFPDMYIYEPRGGYCGLFIEFKAKGKRVIGGSDQEKILMQLAKRGYCVRVIDSLESAIKTLKWYMALGKKDTNQMEKLNKLKKILASDYSDKDLDMLIEGINAIKMSRTKDQVIYL